MMNENEVFKKIDVTTKIDAKENSIVATNATFYSYDTDTSLIKIKLVKDGQPMSLPVGTEVLLTAVKINKDKNKLVFSPQIKDRTQGLIEWIIPQQLRGYVGSLRIGVFIKLPNNQRLHGGYFSVSMDISDIDSDNGWTEIYWQSWDDFQSQAEAEWENWKSQQITKQSKFESDTNVYLNRIETKVDAAQADLTQLKEEMQLSEAWSNSPDGTVDFSKNKPNENLWVQSRMTSGYLNVTTGVITPVPEYTVHQVDPYLTPCGAGVTIIKQTWNPNRINNTANTARVGCYDANRQFIGIIFSDSLNPADHRVTKAITPPLTAYVRLGAVLGYAGGNRDESVKIKFEIGETETPWTSNPADNTPENEFAKYYGLSLTDSNDPVDYVWMESAEYTRYKAKMDAEDSQIAWSCGQEIVRKHLIDFKGKVPGSTVENSNAFLSQVATSLLSPTGSLWVEMNQESLSKIQNLDGQVESIPVTSANTMRQMLFKWNLVDEVNRDYPGLFESVGADTLAKQVAFLKQNLSPMVANVWGYGSGANSTALYAQQWNGSTWVGSNKQTGSTVKQLTIAGMNPNYYLNSDGFVYILTYADPSDGTTASTVNIDYASLEYTLSFKKSDFEISKSQYTQDLGEIKEWIAAHS